MAKRAKCPHCGEQTEVEEPELADGEATVEVQQDCDYCARPVLAVYSVVFRLRELAKA